MERDKILEIIIQHALDNAIVNKEALNTLKRTVGGAHHIAPPSTAELRRAAARVAEHSHTAIPTALLDILRKRDVRTQSGVAIITVLTKPYPCPGTCTYCPTEVRMPKSYIETEPAAQRALVNKFDPYEQVRSRLATLHANGHATDKIELIVKGGTWSAYRWDYQVWFIRRCFDACNEFASTRHARATTHAIVRHELTNVNEPTTAYDVVDTPRMTTHDTIQKFLADECAALTHAQHRNESARQRIIGLTLETRPDWIRPHTIFQLRTLGCTRVELGLQHTDNAILAYVKRGHTIEQTMEAIRVLRHAGFKVDVHTMPQLPGATRAHDKKMYEQLFADERLRPDMIKIYPCVVTPTAEIAQWYANGSYTPYSLEDLCELLIEVKSTCVPPYCRISRLIRDIPGNEIIAGNTITNLREHIQRELVRRGLTCPCLRCREIGHVMRADPSVINEIAAAQLYVTTYRASQGTEYFLSIENRTHRAIFAFARVYLPDHADDAAVREIHRLLPETRHTAFVRELHTYGFLVPVAQRHAHAQQHRGLGAQLMSKAEELARVHGFKKMTVIAGVGVRGYYRARGYRRSGTYMVKSL